MLNARAGIGLVHVPYKGSTEALADLVGKRIDLLFGGIPPALQYIHAGTVRPLAVTSEIQSTKLPNVPTFAESGFPGYKVAFWAGLMAPTGTPQSVIDKLNDAISDAVRSDEVTARFEKIGVEPLNLGPSAYGKRLEADKTMWRTLVQQSKLQLP